MSIPQISQLPPAPQRSDAPADFVAKADAHVASLSQFVAQTNQVVSDINQISPQVADDSALASASAASASATANYKGQWSSLTGALNVPASVKHNGSFYFLLNNLANVALSEPSVTSDWQLIVNVGNIRKSLLDSPLCRLFLPNKIVDTLAGPLTWARASSATYVDRYGVVRTAAIDEPREEKEGWLIEGQSTNLLTYSEQFDNAVWIKSNATITSGAALAPDSTNTADRLTSTDTSDRNLVRQVNAVLGQKYTFSLFVKIVDINFLFIRFSGVAKSSSASIYLDLVSKQAAGFQQGIDAFTFQDVSNGFIRVSATVTADADGVLNAAISTADGNLSLATGSYDIWGAQLEALPFASSYIPTTTAPATRAADLVSASNPNNFGWNSGNTVSFYYKRIGSKVNFADIVRLKSGLGFNYFGYTSFSDGSNDYSNRRNTTSDTATFAPYNMSGTDGQHVVDAATADTQLRYRDGVIVTSNPLVVDLTNRLEVPTDFKMFFGNPVSKDAYFHIQDFRIYDFALNADEAQFLAGVK